jgi:dTDP-4-dehydrorhamnose 3,5-epimerase
VPPGHGESADLPIDGATLLRPKLFGDDRGHFFEAWNEEVFRRATRTEVSFVQDNQSRSGRGVVRGLHYQVDPDAQGKLVRVVAGSVFDVAVDIRRSSPTFSQWVGVELSEENHLQFWIPEGFAHGFVVLSDSADVLYKTTAYYAPRSDRSIRWNDPEIGIDWPLDAEPVLSDKDRAATPFAGAEVFA